MEPSAVKETCNHVEDGKVALDIPTLPDPDREKRLVRKLDRTILPWIMLLYLLSYIDRFVFKSLLKYSWASMQA